MIRVLVVDDDKLVRKGIISAMPWNDFDMDVVGEASNGEKALEFMESHAVDLLVTDLAMPVMSGIQLMRVVRKRFPHVCIVVLTLHQDFEYVQESLRLGAIDYIAKVQLEKEHFEEVLARISGRMRETKQIANDFQADAVSLTDNRDIDEQQRTEQELHRLSDRWSLYEWIYSEAYFKQLVQELRLLRLPQAKLMPFLYGKVYEWNRIFGPLASTRIEMPESFAYWAQAEEWLAGIRLVISRAIHTPAFSPEITKCIMNAVQTIHEHMQRQLTAVEIAKKVNMSRSYFSQCFKDIVGKTFNEYLRHVRMEKAKEYLIGSNKTILSIAESTGYMDEKYFSRIFREHTGWLPSEFRRTKRDGREMSGK